ncbi:hypothetical protein Pla123a_16890 [Posidoniimonas polymericola]|uniref:Uncharacterized protein n=1 Tax=Posidoniimonas polymericola TaxID=2528002 RepID=A0A5C5YSV9_9BACT|nr:hypothetical protein [Posidoniimonas polymericola]TWT77891.1 hypothetical protein Pla123a_16890 [Posidoniimonas polymericola]
MEPDKKPLRLPDAQHAHSQTLHRIRNELHGLTLGFAAYRKMTVAENTGQAELSEQVADQIGHAIENLRSAVAELDAASAAATPPS